MYEFKCERCGKTYKRDTLKRCRFCDECRPIAYREYWKNYQKERAARKKEAKEQKNAEAMNLQQAETEARTKGMSYGQYVAQQTISKFGRIERKW